VQINPKYCVLFDVGTIPRADALVRLYVELEDDPRVGGACGEIAVRDARPWHLLDSSQAFEYLISHTLDKPAESVAGFIGVLPGELLDHSATCSRPMPLHRVPLRAG
jgi:chitin synthase